MIVSNGSPKSVCVCIEGMIKRMRSNDKENRVNYNIVESRVQANGILYSLTFLNFLEM